MTTYAFLTEFAPPSYGGIQSVVGGMVRSLAPEVTLVTPVDSGLPVPHVRRSLFSGSSWPRWWWLVGWLRQASKDGLTSAVFGHFSSAVVAAWILRPTGLRYSVVVHGNDLLTEQRRLTTRWFIGPALRGAEHIFVSSSFVANHVRRYGVRMSKMVVTHPFVSSQDALVATTHAPSQHLVTAARLVPRKNVGLIIQAVAKLRTQFPTVHLDVIGDGPERAQLESTVQALGCSSNITFHGAVDQVQKWRLLRAADIFVLVPTVRQAGTDVEGFGIVYLEAAAARLPVVGSDTGGVRDAVTNGLTGVLIDPKDLKALVSVLTDLLNRPSAAALMGERGQQRIQQEFLGEPRMQRFSTAVRGQSATSPLVSIIIPAYQSATTIVATLRSVIKQSYTNWEMILVDDGSTDDLKTQIGPYRDRLRYIAQANAGAPAARNAGFDHSHGPYLLFLDADVVLDPDMVRRMVVALETHPTASYTYADFDFGWKRFHLREYSGTALRQQNYIHTTSLIRREVFPRFDPTLKRFQDWDLWLTIAERGGRGLWIDDRLFRVQPRRRGVGMSTWLPSFVYRLPFIGQGQGSATVAAYRAAERIIRDKHRL